MNTTLVLVIAFVATLFLGIAIGFMAGLAKGMALGSHFRTDRPVSPIPWVLCFIGSGICLLAALGSSAYSIYFLANSTQTNAVVIEIIESKNDEGHVVRTLVYSYSNAKGETFTDRSASGDGRGFALSDAILVRYLKDSPNQSRIDDFAHHWLLPILMVVFSIMLGGLGLGLRWWREKEQQWAKKRLENKECDSPQT